MPDAPTVAAVRVFVPEASASQRQTQLRAVLGLLRDRLRVRGLTIVACTQGIDPAGAVAVGAVGDDARHDHDPPLVIEFFDEPGAADRARRMLEDLLPECATMWWRASTDGAALRSPAPQAAPAGTASAEQQNVRGFNPPAWMDSTLSDAFGEEHANLLAEGEGNAAAILQRIALAP